METIIATIIVTMIVTIITIIVTIILTMIVTILITIITILSAIIMLNIKFQKPKLFLIVLGIVFSVLIYYVNFFFGALGKNEKLPLLISIWIPVIILSIISIIGMIRINEK